MTANALGEYLRARRADLTPAQAGIITHGRRRVAGLRREEVAVLAGVNADYYARLEQGRERHPTQQVLEALATALQLDRDAREHLYRVSGTAPPAAPLPRRDQVSDDLRQLIDAYTHTPAFVLNPTLDVLASNALADALYASFAFFDNLARMTFLDDAAPVFYRDWERTAHASVANLRRAQGLDPRNPRLVDLVASLTASSCDFRRLWDSHAVQGKRREAKRFAHPEVGPLELTYQAFDVRDAPGQQLVIYHAEPGSRSADALALLGTLHVTHQQEASQA
ncbi:helix-turn-helix transcriptional regulator [Pseudonocardia kujensis]|uniref:helix-turn-helix transcriptional regulator n=1 Tax=Pseudonocardia kujensis TaxID=1128675 RepID=UPI001E56C1BF|nr:helix-turn-helix transcriptional regulator [Pseudonocardia kujensis]MCE0762089.1 helix-turn-helix transcriptional regulator [Pseudonocardia kujensis]